MIISTDQSIVDLNKAANALEHRRYELDTGQAFQDGVPAAALAEESAELGKVVQMINGLLGR